MISLKSAYVSKKYNYISKYFDLNSGINFLANQTKEINNIDISLLTNYKDYLEREPKFSNNADALIIENDIKQFLAEYNNAVTILQRTLKRTTQGAYGENKVRASISTFNNEWKVIHNATLNIEGTKIENDFLIIDESGISTIEVKNIGNEYEKLIVDDLGRVSRLNKFNNEIETFDMVAQSNRHLGYLKRFIEKHSKIKIPVNAIIVVASNIKIRNQSDFKIIGPNQIYSEIKKQVSVLTKDEIELIYQNLLETLVEGTKYPYINYIEKLKENYTLILKSLKELLM